MNNDNKKEELEALKKVTTNNINKVAGINDSSTKDELKKAAKALENEFYVK